jgi:hypothetical protein
MILMRHGIWLLMSLWFGVSAANAAERTVRNPAELRVALAQVNPGSTLLIALGEYGGGYELRGVNGTAAAPVVIRAADPKNPPTFTGGRVAWSMSDCTYVTLRGLTVRGSTGNGLNIDDGGTFQTPAHHIVIEDVTVLDVGPRGNLDGLKMSGVDDFVVRRCRFEGWGGSAIDMVGCHRGVVEDSRFTGKDGFSQANAVQMKGGSSDILVQTSVFDRAGERAINLGGSTGLQFFRPAPGEYEASRITVAGNRFLGSLSPIAWVSADGGRVYRNTIQLPDRWVARVLQEQTAPQFKPCRGGVFEENLVVFDRRVAAFVNVGPKTAPETFVFRRNAWFQTDGSARPSLPTAEQDGVHQVDPKLDRPATPEARATSTDPRLKGIGADHYQPRR